MKRILTVALILTLAGCGVASNKKDQPKGAVAAQDAEQLAIDSKAPKYIVAIVDKDGKVVSTRATDEAAIQGTAQEIAAYETAKAGEGKITVVNSDSSAAVNSTESCFSWNHGYGYGYGYGLGYGYAAPVAWGYNYYPTYAYSGYNYGYYPASNYYYGGYNYYRWGRGGRHHW